MDWKYTLTTPFRWGTAVDGQRRRSRALSLPVPVVSVGNLHFGGAGKTPMAMWLAEALQAQGRHPSILLRGYGGGLHASRVLQGKGEEGGSWNRLVVEVESGESRPAWGWSEEMGDEACLLASRLPGIPIGVGADRKESFTRVAEACPGVDCAILDDGFQHAEIHRDFDIVMLPVSLEPDRLRLRPGPLREDPSSLSRAHHLVWVADDPSPIPLPRVYQMRNFLDTRLPWSMVSREPVTLRRWPDGEAVPIRSQIGQRAVALTGLGDPPSFAWLADRLLGVDFVHQVSRPDHHRFTPADLSEAEKWFRRWDADLVLTSEKDALRLPSGFSPPFPLFVVGIQLAFFRGEESLKTRLP